MQFKIDLRLRFFLMLEMHHVTSVSMFARHESIIVSSRVSCRACSRTEAEKEATLSAPLREKIFPSAAPQDSSPPYGGETVSVLRS
jgi:hypothetical protein